MNIKFKYLVILAIIFQAMSFAASNLYVIESNSIKIAIDSNSGLFSGCAMYGGKQMNISNGAICFYDKSHQVIRPVKRENANTKGCLQQKNQYSFGNSTILIKKQAEGFGIDWQVTNTSSEQQLIMVSFELGVGSREKSAYIGRETLDLTKQKSSIQWDSGLGMYERIPLICVYDKNIALGMALDAEEVDSEWIPELKAKDDGKTIIAQTIRIVLDPNGTYNGHFVMFGCSPKYQERYAVDTWQQMYPKMFKRRADVDQRIYGICATYLAWDRNDSEVCRITGADWDWCINPFRRNGDIADSQQYWDYKPVRPFEKNDNVSRDAWLKRQSDKLAHGKQCNTAMMFYNNSGTWVESKLISNFPDSLITKDQTNGQTYLDSWGTPQDDAQAAFSYQTSWGDYLRKSWSEIAKRPNVAGAAFDSPNGDFQYRGSGLKRIARKSWDEKGPYVSNAVAIGYLLDYISSLKTCSGLHMATVTNINEFEHFLLPLRTDMCLIEKNAWAMEPPYPLQHRYAMGEKGITWWEGYHIDDMMNVSKSSDEVITETVRGLADYTALRSLFAGVSYQHLFSSGVEYLIRLIPMFNILNDATWKPVLAFQTDRNDLWLSRYGEKFNSFLVIGNPTGAIASTDAKVFGQELGLDGTPVLSDYYGNKTVNVIDSNQALVHCKIASRKPKVLKTVAYIKAPAECEIFVSESSDFSIITREFQIANKTKKAFKIVIPSEQGSFKFTDCKLNGETISSVTSHENIEVAVPASDKCALAVLYTSSLTNLNQNEILSFRPLSASLESNFKILTNGNAEGQFYAERLNEMVKNYALMRCKLNDPNNRINISIESGVDSKVPDHTIAMLFGKVYNKSFEQLLQKVNGPFIYGDKSKEVLFLAGNSEADLKTIVYTYMNLLSQTIYPDWRSTTVQGGVSDRNIRVPISESEKEMFGHVFAIAFQEDLKGVSVKQIARKSEKQNSSQVDDPNIKIIIRPYLADENENLLNYKAWKFDASKSSFEHSVTKTIAYPDGGQSLYIKSLAVKDAGYWDQHVNVQPGKKYFISTWVKNSGAHILLRIYGNFDKSLFDKRIYLNEGGPGFLEPVFFKSVKAEKTSDTWQLLAGSFTVPQGFTSFDVALGSYFNTGQMWFSGMVFTENTPSIEVALTSTKKIRTVEVYMQSTGDMIYSKQFINGEIAFKSVIRDTQADQPYRVRVTFDDGTTIIKSYNVTGFMVLT